MLKRQEMDMSYELTLDDMVQDVVISLTQLSKDATDYDDKLTIDKIINDLVEDYEQLTGYKMETDNTTEQQYIDENGVEWEED